MKQLSFFLLFILLASSKLFAVPAYPYPINYRLPDNTEITIQLHGDEFINWASSSDGYTLLINSTGYYEYAIQDNRGDLVPSGVRANNEAERTIAETSFLQQTPKNLNFSTEQISMIQQIRDARDNALRSQQATTISGTVYAPIILVQFPGKPFTKTSADFQNLINQVNYSAGTATGSVHDYFLATSYGQLDFQVNVFGPYTLAHSIGYYDNNTTSNSNQTVEIIGEATTLAIADGCNFSNYDSDGNGIVDGIHLIYAGYDQSAGAPKGSSIWASAWSTSGTFCTRNGKRINRFSMSSELRSTSGTTITPIGVIAHELSHVFGLPDLYDTDYANSGGQSVHLDKWDVMASGSWNNNGDTPPYHSAWCRDKIGWVPAIELTAPTDITLPNPMAEGVSYKITTSTPKEYFLVENRQKQAWDAYIPSSGLLIYHVDENAGTQSVSGWRDVNINPAHRGLYVKQAGGNAGSTTTDRTRDPYPYGTNNSFTDASVPNSKSWAGNNTGKPITDISHNTSAKTVFFKFMGGTGASATCPLPTISSASDITSSSANISWTINDATQWYISYKKQSSLTWEAEILATTSNYKIEGLSAGTNYDVRVRAFCGESDYSAYSEVSFTTTLCDIEDKCNYTLIANDGYGDGWNGAALVFKQNSIEVGRLMAMNHNKSNTLSSDTLSIPLCSGIITEIFFVSGSYDYEISFTLKDIEGNIITSVSNASTLPTGTAFFTFTPSCGVLPSGTRTWNGATSDWTVAANWTPAQVPTAEDDVVIPKITSSNNYPVVPASGATIKNITIQAGAELGRQDLLSYEKAFVQYDFSDPDSRDRWHMLSVPLQEAYPGDFTFGGYPLTWVRNFVAKTNTNGVVQAGWETVAGSNMPFSIGNGFVVWLNENAGVDNKGLALSDGILELPYFDNVSVPDTVHYTHEFNEETKESTFYNFTEAGEKITLESYQVNRTASAYQLAGSRVDEELNFGYDGDSEFTLVGNPFMANLNFDTLQTTPENAWKIKSSYQIWTGKGEAAGYAGYITGGSYFGLEPNEALTEFIAPTQSFIVEKQVSASGYNYTRSSNYTPSKPVLTFDISMTEVGQTKLRNATTQPDKLDIVARNEVAAVRTFIAQREDGQTEFGGNDSRKLMNGISRVPEIYSLKPSGSNQVAVGANFINTDNQLVPVGLATAYSGEITLTFTGMDTYQAKISLLDVVENKEIDLTGLSSYEYKFNYLPLKQIDGQVLANEDRFFIRFSPTNLTGLSGLASAPVSVFDKGGVIHAVSGASDLIKEVSVYNLQGVLLQTNTVNTAYYTSNHEWLSGIYVVKVVSEKGTQNVKLIIK